MVWEKKRYHSDKEFRKRKIEHSRKYQKTKKGKIAMKKSYENQKKSNYGEKWRKKHKGYFSKYMKKKRKEARKNKICITCFKRKAKKGLVLCNKCRRN